MIAKAFDKIRIANSTRQRGVLVWLTAAAWVYFTVLFGWLLIYLVSGDRFGYIALINSMAVNLFIPLPLVGVLAIFVRRRDVWIEFAIGVLAFIWFWGGLFVPRIIPPGEGEVGLKVMTYNVLGLHLNTTPMLQVLRQVDADIVFLQEVNTYHAEAIRQELSDLYPYQIMDAKDDVIGIGTLSKYPIRLTGEQLPLVWVGVPQVMALEWGNQTVHMVNFHMWATHIARAELLEENFRDREAQAAVLVKYVERVNGPVIVAGDANTTSLNTAYKILASSMADTWARAGFGMGHTFPGSDLPGSSRPRIGKWMAPQWFARIDYLFVSDDWVTTEAYLAPFDGVSDHRGVVARISLVRD